MIGSPRRALAAVTACAASAACAAPARPAEAPVLGPPAEVAPPAVADDLDPAVAPRAYRLDLTLDPRSDRFRGEIEIDLSLARARRALWLHGVGLTLERAHLTAGGERWPIATLAAAPGSGLIGFDLGREVGAGTATVSIAFAADFRALDGIFVQEYRARRYIFSDFEPIDARRAFPCFDAPRFKTPWTVSLTVPRGQLAVGNMPVGKTVDLGERIRYQLEPTRPLPSYLVAVAVGPFDVIETRGSPVPLRLLVAEGRTAAATAARTLAPEMVAASVAFLGREVPFPKLDIVAVPSFGGAMENPGLITMAADILLPAPGDVDAERFLALVLAHEAAHLWFGDLVTPGQWRDLWLNEGFASWMADEVLAITHPSWSTRLGELDDRAEAMAEDAVPGVRPVRPVATPAPRDLFDVIGYKKSAALLHMIEGWLGLPVVAAAVSRYLDDHRDGTVTTADVVAALSAAEPARGADIAAVLTSFLDQPGLPRVDGRILCEPGRARLAVRLSRHVLAGDAGTGGWSVPLCVRWGSGGRAERRCQVVTRSAELALGATCPTWLTVNSNGDGYYQWSLAAAELAAVATAADASPRERIDAVRQVEPALLTGALSAVDAATVLDAAIRRGEPRVAAAALDTVRTLRDEIAPAIAHQLAPALTLRLRAIGLHPARGESPATADLRPALIVAAGRAGDARVTAWARRETQRWLDRRPEIDGDLLLAALTVAAAAADRGEIIALIDAVIARSAVELRRAAPALAAVRPQLADEVLARSRRGGAALQLILISRLLGRFATADAAAAAAEADTALAPIVAGFAPCDAAIQARVAAAMGDAARAPHLERIVARSAARASACESARLRSARP